jgi:hypothetical protein
VATRRLKDAAFPLLIFALNFYFVKELFSLEYSQFMSSIEASYISISRYMIDNWRDLSWFPLWYGGIPFQNSYPPLLHAIVAVASVVLRISPAHSHHLATAVFYCFGPVALYALALRLTGSRWYSFWAAWLYSIFAPSLYLLPSVRIDLGSYFGLRRFQALLPYGEGPHITSMALLPVALLALDFAISKRTALRCTLAALALAAVALSNWLGTFALAIAVVAYLVARTNSIAAWRTWLITLGLGALAYAFACSWIPPSTIRVIRHNAQFIGGTYAESYRRLPLVAVLAILIVLALKYAMHRFRASGALQFFVLFTLLVGAIPFCKEWFHFILVPQPDRYHLEMDIAVCLALPFALQPWINRLPRLYQAAMAAALIALSVYPARLDRRYSRHLLAPIDVKQTPEYKLASWFDTHMHGGRVMAPGTVSYWLNAFTDTPQFGGGFDQGIVNPLHAGIQYQLYSADSAGNRAAEIDTTWFRAYGVQAVAVADPEKRDPTFSRPEIFPNAFQEAMHEGRNAVYWVPGHNSSLAHIVERGDLVRDPPYNGLDIAEAEHFADALTTPLSFAWTSRHSAEIAGTVASSQLISVQITYHKGWHAAANDKPCHLFGDGLSQMVIEPGCNGSCSIHLSYDGGAEMRVARILSWSSLAGCLVWIVVSRRRSR